MKPIQLFPMQAIDGRWHLVYRDAATGELVSVADSACQDQIRAEAKQSQREIAAEAA